MSKLTGFTEHDVPNQMGKTFIVTGANTGLGFETSRVLAARGARVLLACRNAAKAQVAIERIRQASPGAELAFLPLDLTDLANVRAAAELAATEPRIDALINNAGVMTPPLLHTQQGFELQFGVNHFGCFALTALLLPKLAQTKGARIVVTSGLAHRDPQIYWDDLNAEKSYSRFERYAASKLANMLFFFELNRRLRASDSSVTAVGCHPGLAPTEIGRHMGALRIFQSLVFGLLANSAAMGASPTLQAATGPITPGRYYGPIGFRETRGPSGEASRSAQAVDPELATRLWDVSIAMTHISPGLAAVG
jgi:NAD(P)-dependent dehydrogenase (short-subunit alcohol dehydrogenase family)